MRAPGIALLAAMGALVVAIAARHVDSPVAGDGGASLGLAGDKPPARAPLSDACTEGSLHCTADPSCIRYQIVVLDAWGRAVSSCVCTAGSHVARASATAPGVFEVSATPGQLLRVEAPGYMPWADDLPGDDSRIRVVLERAYSLAGSILDPNGVPCSGARVSAVFSDRRLFETWTDSSGRFILSPIPIAHDEVRLRAVSPDESSRAETTVSVGDDTIVLRLARRRRVQGRVVLSTGEAAWDVRVRGKSCDADGWYSIWVPTHAVSVRAERVDAGGQIWQTEVQLAEGSSDCVLPHIALGPPPVSFVRIRMRRSDGQPITYTPIDVRVGGRHRATGFTDDAGEALIRVAVPPGTRVLIDSPIIPASPWAVTTNADQGHAAQWIELAHPVTIRVVVLHPTGEEAVDAEVRLSRGARVSRNEWSMIPGAPLRVAATARGSADASMDVPNVTDGMVVTVQLASEVRLFGRLHVPEPWDSIDRFIVDISVLGPNPARRHVKVGRSREFTAFGLSTGRIAVRVYTTDCELPVAGLVVMAERPGTIDCGELRIGGAVDLHGSVQDEVGRPLPGAVAVFVGDAVYSTIPTATDSTGRFNLPVPETVSGEIVITRAGYAAATVPYQPGATSASVRLAPEGRAVVRGSGGLMDAGKIRVLLPGSRVAVVLPQTLEQDAVLVRCIPPGRVVFRVDGYEDEVVEFGPADQLDVMLARRPQSD